MKKKVAMTVFSIFVLMATPFILGTTEKKQQAEAQLQAQGELLRVDPDSSTLTIKSESGQEIEFSYNESTAVMGADQDAAGLATVTGSNVKIEYRVENDQKIALKIHVE